MTHCPTLTLYTRALTPYPPFCVLIIRHIFRRKLFCLLFLLFSPFISLSPPSYNLQPLTSHFLLLIFYFLLLTSHFPLFASYYLLSTSHLQLPTSHFPLPTSHFTPLTLHLSPLTPHPIPLIVNTPCLYTPVSFSFTLRSHNPVYLFSAGWLCGTYTLIRSYNKKMQSYIKIDCIF